MGAINATDFEYDGKYLSEFGFVICSFDSSDSGMSVVPGAEIEFVKVQRNGGRKNSLVATKYSKSIQATFDIFKDPDSHIGEEKRITNDEYRELSRWLCRHDFLELNIMYDDLLCYCNAAFNVGKIYVGGELYGLRLTMETNSPYAYGRITEKTHTFDDISAPFEFVDNSDEIGAIYPVIHIVCNEDGNLVLTNELMNSVMQIKNCRAGEEIVVDCDNQIITSSYNGHDIANDFNYEFLEIGNTFRNRVNRIFSTLGCTLKIKYRPVIKYIP